ncbi:MAG: AMP-binding protein [Microthrixaceae bacterium]
MPSAEQLDNLRGVLVDPVSDVVLPFPAGDPPAASRACEAARLAEPLSGVEDDAEDPTVVAIATTGSTGAPRVVLLSRSALQASIRATEERLGGPGHWLLCLGVDHIAGLQVVLRAAAARTGLGVIAPGGPGFAEAFAGVGHEPGRRYVSLVPTQLRRLLADEAATAALAGYDAVLVGGAASDPTLLARARSASVRVVTSYGMTETCGGCVYDGRALAPVEVSVDGAGVISLAGPMVARGYRGGPAFGGRVETSDVGRFVDGRLEVLGRVDDVVVTAGHNVAPTEVEAAIRAVPGVRDAAVFGLPDPERGRIVAALVVGEVGEERIRSALAVTLAAHARPRLLVRVEEIPRRGIGKLDRAEAERLLRRV